MSNPLQMPDQEGMAGPDPDAPPPYQPTGEMPEPTFPENPPQPPQPWEDEDEEEE